jgi:uncharacterized membrane protein AbrB (regulator of aidB expression)
MRRFLSILEDILLLAGCVCVEIGLAQVSIPLTWIVGGLMLAGLAVRVRMERA